MHHAPVGREFVVAVDDVLHGAVVPHQHVADLPLVMVLELRLDYVLGELPQQRQGFLVRHAGNAGAFIRRDIDRLAPGHRMRARDRVVDRRVLVELFLGNLDRLFHAALLGAEEMRRRAPVNPLAGGVIK